MAFKRLYFLVRIRLYLHEHAILWPPCRGSHKSDKEHWLTIPWVLHTWSNYLPCAAEQATRPGKRSPTCFCAVQTIWQGQGSRGRTYGSRRSMASTSHRACYSRQASFRAYRMLYRRFRAYRMLYRMLRYCLRCRSAISYVLGDMTIDIGTSRTISYNTDDAWKNVRCRMRHR